MAFLVSSFLISFLLILFPFHVLAQDLPAGSQDATTSAKSTFEVFWPLTAGRTIDDPLYSLKELKETLRGIFIFGNGQKADYAVLLGTKRVLEADKLIQDGKKDLADKTLTKALKQFDIAEKNIKEAKSNKRPIDASVAIMKPRLNNLSKLLSTMESVEAKKVLEKITELQTSL